MITGLEKQCFVISCGLNIKQTSLTLNAAPPLESPSSFVNIAPVIPISRLNADTKAAQQTMGIITNILSPNHTSKKRASYIFNGEKNTCGHIFNRERN